MNVPTIYPTHSCFDDVTNFLNMLALRLGSRAELERYTVVHAICLRPDGSPYAHGWIECEGMAITAGLLNGRYVFYRMDREEYRRARCVWDETRYTVPEMIEAEDAHGLPPYVPEYRALCTDINPSSDDTPKQWPVVVESPIEVWRGPAS